MKKSGLKSAILKRENLIYTFLLICLVFVTGCNIPTRSKKPEKLPKDAVNGPYYHSGDYVINQENLTIPTDSITVQYLGCGGFYIQKNDIAFLVDPFFSNVKMLPGYKLNLRRIAWLGMLAKRNVKIKPHIKSINLGYNLITRQPGFVIPQTILVTHGHYDHLLDVPYIYYNKFSDTLSPTIYGSLTSTNLLSDIIPEQKLRNLEPIMETKNTTGTWTTIGEPTTKERIRFMAIEADHAPHAKSLKLFDGDGVNSVGDYETYLNGTSINKWLEGRTLGFIIDFMEGDKIAYRMFLQTSACSPTRGLLSEKLLKEKAVDMAVICVASYELVDAYPEAVLRHLNPAHVMLVHWEDFLFKSYEKNLRKPKTIGFSDVGDFIKLMENTRQNNKLRYKYSMPAPGVKATVKLGEIN